MSLAVQSREEPLSKQRLRLWLRLLKASGLIEEQVRRHLRAEFSTTLPRFDVMSALNRYPGGLKMSAISRMLRVSNGNITGIVDKLTEEGLAQRVSLAGDRRANLVQLTDKGLSEFARQAAAHETWIDGLLDDLDKDALTDLGRRLDNLAKSLEEKERNDA